ncbi:TrbC/VirB2 family protein [Novosphingobium terrae]|uniref:TrbC/VirB2 family protein n=1 Tax=Novosphingobium terrae TaxID=2726189 RepID=UPI00197E6645|nr:TrbC/VirB2 family protein [Novosphingobium terrae]
MNTLRLSQVRNPAYLELALVAAIILLAMLWPHSAYASTSGGGLPYESYLTQIRQSATGPIAYAFAIVGIVAAGGVLVLGGDLNGFVRTLMMLVLVVSLLVGANAMLSSISSGGAMISSVASVASHGQ